MTAALIAPPVTAPAYDDLEATWDRLAGLLARFGVTRVGDVTGLDALGLPTAIAVRPGSHTISVSQGKGATLLHAKVSAAMESIEGWHTEHLRADLVRRAGVDGLGLTYDVRELPGARRPWVAARREERWFPATGLRSGAATWVPASYLDLSLDGQRDPMRSFVATSNGLAADTCRDRAVRHALCEVVERDAVADLATTPLEQRTYVDLEHLPDAASRLVDHLREHEVWIEVVGVPSLPGTTTLVAYLWSEAMPTIFAGSACRREPEAALVAAVTEAAQSRLTVINGTREDVPLSAYLDWAERQRRRPDTPPGAALVRLPDAPPAGGPADDVRRLVDAITERTGHEPLLADLSHPGTGLHVVRVVAPGLRFDLDHDLPRDEERA